MAAIFSMITLAAMPILDHSMDVGVHTVYMDKEHHYGHEISYTGSLIFDSFTWKVTPRQLHFHNGTYLYSFETGPEIQFQNNLIGLKVAYDISNMSGAIFQQKSVGFEFINEDLEFSVRHYSPWPNGKEVGKNFFKSYSYTDLEIAHKLGNHRIGFSPYFIEKEVGTKVFIDFMISKMNVSTIWKFDKINEHSFTLGISFNFLSPKKLKSHHFPFIHTKRFPLAPSNIPTHCSPFGKAPSLEEDKKKIDAPEEKISWFSFFFK